MMADKWYRIYKSNSNVCSNVCEQHEVLIMLDRHVKKALKMNPDTHFDKKDFKDEYLIESNSSLSLDHKIESGAFRCIQGVNEHFCMHVFTFSQIKSLNQFGISDCIFELNPLDSSS